MKMEIVTVKVRPSYGDKKMHVFRFLISSELFSVDLIKTKLCDIFPYGFFKPVIERYMIDYVFDSDNDSFISLCNHDYLTQYLTSAIKNE